MPLRPLLLLSLLLAGCVAHAAPATTDYAISMTRKAAVGDTYGIVATGMDEKSATMRLDGQDMPPRMDAFSVELTGKCETLAVNGKSKEKKMSLVIEKFVRTVAGRATELLPAGTVVIGERVGEDSTFAVDGSPVAPDVAQALAAVGISLAEEDGVDDDDVFGTKERKKVGDSWPINAAVAAADLAKDGIPAEAGNLTGTTTLVEIITHGPVPLMRLSATMAMKGVNPPVPPGMEVQSSEFSGTHSALFPLDLTKRVHQESSSMSISVTAGGVKDGKPIVMTMAMKTSHDTKFIRN